MSLKAFHVFFIVAASALSFGFGAWSVRTGEHGSLGTAGFALGAALAVYLVWFLRKPTR